MGFALGVALAPAHNLHSEDLVPTQNGAGARYGANSTIFLKNTL
jgi:hypothetical protein